MSIRKLLAASKHINFNRLSTGTYGVVDRWIILTRGLLEILVSQGISGKGLKVHCNMCGWRGRSFVNFYTGYGHVYEKAVCPACYSHPRHRSYVYSIDRLMHRKEGPIKVLHCSPEHPITELINQYRDVLYLSIDIDHTKAMRTEDIQDMSFEDASFDVIICIHVFEHVEHDEKAMSEVFRVLKPGGVALLDVPIDYDREQTYEDKSITTPEGRTAAFWQWDHLRLYGRDYPSLLRQAGFEVKEEHIISQLSEEAIARHGLVTDPNYICSKP